VPLTGPREFYLADVLDITGLLKVARDQRDTAAVDRIVAFLYPDLHRMAAARLARCGTITQLDATSMVHETYERLRKAAHLDAHCRGQFMAYASQVMRSVIVDFVRKRRADRRGGAAVHVTLSTDVLGQLTTADDDIERVNDALQELEGEEPRLKQLIEMRYFGGFDDQEIGDALGISERTVRRDWQRAKLLLQIAIRR
jgi:RNA polymerase sigma factor (TIGR02999 family)